MADQAETKITPAGFSRTLEGYIRQNVLRGRKLISSKVLFGVSESDDSVFMMFLNEADDIEFEINLNEVYYHNNDGN